MIREEDLAGAEFFEKLTKKGKEAVVKSAQKAAFKKKERLPVGFASFFLVRRGAVGVFTSGESGAEAFLYGAWKDDACFVSDNLLYESIGNAEIVYWTESGLETLRANAQFSSYLAETAAKQAEEAADRFNQVMFTSVDKRLATFLSNAAARSRTHAVALTQEEIAKYVGTSREVVTRKLKAWEEEGIVACARGKVWIENKEGLKKKR